ncbi:MAG: DUF3108 domain-containing protein [Burkholderiales bacterium]|nr:DUF3108 domain-containing protein [Burkholderiales bacterium]
MLALLGLLAALLHAGALSGRYWAWPQREVPPLPAPAMQVRAMADVPSALAARAAVPARAEPAPPAVAPAAQRPAAVVRQVVPAAEPATAVSVAASPPPSPEPAPSATEDSIPHYRTLPPPAVTLHYDLQRGPLRGNGELKWRPGADGYELRLEGRVAGLAVLTQVSRGGFDESGVAPLRFTDRRVRRPLSAANFQREAGKITFSGPQAEYPLHPGAQDRLSWMIQLGAIVAAEPGFSEAGAKVVLFVSGAHGDAGVWSFLSLGPDAVESRAGTVAAIRFRRQPRGPYDTTVEVWLDPQRHHLPVRASLRAGPNDDGLDLRLQDMEVPP